MFFLIYVSECISRQVVRNRAFLKGSYKGTLWTMTTCCDSSPCRLRERERKKVAAHARKEELFRYKQAINREAQVHINKIPIRSKLHRDDSNDILGGLEGLAMVVMMMMMMVWRER